MKFSKLSTLALTGITAFVLTTSAQASNRGLGLGIAALGTIVSVAAEAEHNKKVAAQKRAYAAKQKQQRAAAKARKSKAQKQAKARKVKKVKNARIAKAKAAKDARNATAKAKQDKIFQKNEKSRLSKERLARIQQSRASASKGTFN